MRLFRASARVKGEFDWSGAFLAVLSMSGNIRLSAFAVGISRQAAYKRRGVDEAFREGWDAAILEASDRLHEEAWRRAVDGVDEYVVAQGRLVLDLDGTPLLHRRYSDMLLDRLLKAHMPEKFRERFDISGKRSRW